MQKIISNIFLVMICGALIMSCTNGSSSSPTPIPTQTPQYKSIAIPTTSYSGSKFAIYTSVAGGKPALTEIDTGSDFLLIESSFVGSNIKMTNESITFTYDHGTNPRTGYLGYTTVSLLSSDMNPIITTNDQVPVIVVPDGGTGNGGNNAIMGLRINGNVSLKLFLPYPYNQMMVADFANSQLIFGNLTESEVQKFGTVQLPKISCNNSNVQTSASAPCWNDMALPVNYIISGNPTDEPLLVNSLFDSGASSSYQNSPLPNWFSVDNEGNLQNSVSASITTTSGKQTVYLTPKIGAYDTLYNGNIFNVGNNIFNYYQILFDQADGKIGLK